MGKRARLKKERKLQARYQLQADYLEHQREKRQAVRNIIKVALIVIFIAALGATAGIIMRKKWFSPPASPEPTPLSTQGESL